MQLYHDKNDGMTYEWDLEKKAWFPRINEDFVAQYQMNYGFTKDGKAEPTKPDEEDASKKEEAKATTEEQPAEAKKAKKEKPQWYVLFLPNLGIDGSCDNPFLFQVSSRYDIVN